MKRQKPRTLEIGSISSGTLRLEDLIPSLIWELRRLRLSRAERTELREIESHQDRETDPEGDWDRDEELQWDYESLSEIADNHTPDYCYFGSTEGDGAEIGIWPSSDLLWETRSGSYDGVFRSDKTPAEYRSAFYNGHANGISYQSADRQEMKTEWYGPISECSHWLYVNDHGNATLYRRSGRSWRQVWSVV